MKTSFIYIILIALLIGCSNEPKAVISGSLPNKQYDGEWIYLVPFKGATAQTVDSAQIKNASFRFNIPDEKIGQFFILRVQPLLRLRLQDIIVIPETGLVQVKMDSCSNASGTPLNTALQEWKDKKEAFGAALDSLKIHCTEKEQYEAKYKELYNEYYSSVNKIINDNKQNLVGDFLNTLYK
ncbi:MAG: DUF4369 domain-containing protein [Dysgonamonadaceae bacterium]|jgi:hypothetical protein|nr:DUF4369 domain-containing protein [Dysgonamonadaceae bacterium]